MCWQAMAVYGQHAPFDAQMPYLNIRLAPLPVVSFLDRQVGTWDEYPASTALWHWFQELPALYLYMPCGRRVARPPARFDNHGWQRPPRVS